MLAKDAEIEVVTLHFAQFDGKTARLERSLEKRSLNIGNR